MSVKLEHDLADLGVAVRGEKDGIELAVLRLAALLPPLPSAVSRTQWRGGCTADFLRKRFAMICWQVSSFPASL